MRNISAIAKRELRSYFNSPVAYIVIVTFLAIAGWIFFGNFFLIGRAEMRGFFQPNFHFYNPASLLIFMVPAVTMGLMAEERRSGTIELLTTLPVKDSEIILGKFIAAFVLLLIALGATITYPIAIASIGDLDWGPVFTGYIGMALFIGASTALGLWFSTTTDNQITAFIISVVVMGGLYFCLWLAGAMWPSITEAIQYISLSFHLSNIARGVLDTRDLLYYFTVTGGALYMAVRSLNLQHA